MFSLDLENSKDPSYCMDDVIVLEIEVKGSVEPFQVLLEPPTGSQGAVGGPHSEGQALSWKPGA